MRRFLPAVAATVLTAGALAIPAIAQDAGGDTGTSTEASDTPPPFERREEMRARFDELLAEELGVTVDEFTAARDAVRETLKAEVREDLVAHLQARVDAGEITQERMDEILARFDEHDGPGFGPGPGRGPGDGPGHRRGPGGPGFHRGPFGPDGGAGDDADGTAL